MHRMLKILVASILSCSATVALAQEQMASPPSNTQSQPAEIPAMQVVPNPANSVGSIGGGNISDSTNMPKKDISMPSVSSKEINLILKNHRFDKTKVQIDAGKKYLLTVENHDKDDEEFDSGDLGVEQYIKGGQKATFEIGPLKAGTYEFEGEMSKSAKGIIVAK